MLVIEQYRIEVNVSLLSGNAWIEYRLTKPDDELILEDFGLRCTLADLYRGARLTCCASSFEGFGLSVLESIATGTAVACSLTSTG